MNYFCNICESTNFVDSNNRKSVQCSNCLSLERHRLMWILIEQILKDNHNINILHLAPEKCIHNKIKTYPSNKYYATDIRPEKYNNECVKMSLTDCVNNLSKNYFDLILHNHVLEHVEGSYIDHTLGLISLLKKNGTMLFTIPRHKFVKKTVESLYSDFSDEIRKKIFGQEDHLKKFSADAFNFLNSYGKFTSHFFDNKIRTKLNASFEDNKLIFGQVYVFKKMIDN